MAALQIALAHKGLYRGTIDGHWGRGTEAAVRRLQRNARIGVDGVPGPRTRRALGKLGRHSYGSRMLVAGRVGWDVSQTQFLLAWHGFPSGPMDGRFGPRTTSAVQRFQAHAHLGADGVAGPATLRGATRDRSFGRGSASRRRSAATGRTASGRAGIASTRGSTIRPTSARAFARRRRAAWRRSAGIRAGTATSWSSSTLAGPTPGTRTSHASASRSASVFTAAGGSAASAQPGAPPGRTCTSSSGFAARA